jgi:hypothetical protein
VWVRRAAIRPVPPFARVSEFVLERLELEISRELDGDNTTSHVFDEALERFEQRQPALFAHLEQALTRTKNEPALGFGYFLILAVFLAFERAFGDAIDKVSELNVESVEQALGLDEELRMADAAEVVESDDVVAMEQPHLLAYIQDHVEAALEAHADEVDVDEVHKIYRAVLIEVLSLSYAVKDQHGESSSEVFA